MASVRYSIRTRCCTTCWMLNRKRQNERLQIGEQKGKYGEYCQSSELGFLGFVCVLEYKTHRSTHKKGSLMPAALESEKYN